MRGNWLFLLDIYTSEGKQYALLDPLGCQTPGNGSLLSPKGDRYHQRLVVLTTHQRTGQARPKPTAG